MPTFRFLPAALFRCSIKSLLVVTSCIYHDKPEWLEWLLDHEGYREIVDLLQALGIEE